MRGVWTCVLLASAVAADDTIRIPIQVDQQGKTINFVINEQSHVELEARRFCSAHLPGMDEDECLKALLSQVETVRKVRHESQMQLPGIKFDVQNFRGDKVTFMHEEGANPNTEAREFCQLHFAGVPEDECVEAMLQNAQRALEEIKQKHEL
jgi:CYTH domain-containing protein